MAAVLKTAEGKPSVGSNPTLSAKFKHKKPKVLYPKNRLIATLY